MAEDTGLSEDEEISALQPMAAATASSAASESNTLVKERFEIKYSQPLPHLDSNGAKAYVAYDKINTKRELFALVCNHQNPPRLSLLPYLKSLDHPNILKLVEFGVVKDPSGNTHSMILIYRIPGPRANAFTPEDADLRTNPERFKSLLLSMVAACESLKGYNLTHRAIRLDNLFYRDNTRKELVLGDCAATFPALNQPPAYETIESLLCLPEGRGNGNNTSDIYASAVVMLGLMFQHDPSNKLTAPEMLRLKIKKGSYLALTDNERVHSQYIPVLKAMLSDNQENRWNYLQIFNYLEGKANSFSNSEQVERSMRALTIANEKHYTPQNAAIALWNNPEEGLALLQTGKLQEWIKNGLENERLYQRIDKLFHQETSSPLPAQIMIGQVCILLDYTLPLKVGSIFVFPDGLPKAVFHYLQTDQNLNDFYSVLSSDLIKQWYQEQPQLRAPAGSGELKAFISRRDYGYGIDRVIYDFDEDLPCISPLLSNEFVNSPSQVLRALDNNYSQFKDRPPYDRNLIAYLRCKMGKKVDGILTDLNSRQDFLQSSAVIRLYANIQNKYGPVQLLDLTAWLLTITKPIINNYHNLQYRRYLERELVKISKAGKIIELYDLLENETAKQQDRNEYSKALKDISLLTNERNRIVNGGSRLDEESREFALRAASLLAIIVMASSFAINILTWVIK